MYKIFVKNESKKKERERENILEKRNFRKKKNYLWIE